MLASIPGRGGTSSPYWVRPWRGSLADILAKSASNILIKKENGALHPPY